jgi:Fur family ferric uptake transcriptional regulator
MPTSSLDHTVETRLRAREIRYTTARRAVVGALSSAEGPRSAGELSADLKGRVPLSSVYRTLTVLEDAGVVVPHFGTRGLTRYELAEWIAGHHHHLVCMVCGGVQDIDIPARLETRVREVVGELAGMMGFESRAHTLEIEGRCAECR